MLAINPRWLTTNVLDLAAAVRDERDVSRLPILADALMDAGCDDEPLLAYLRSRDDSWPEYLDWFVEYQLTRHGREPEADDLLDWLARWSRGVEDAIATVKDYGARLGKPGWYDEDPEPMTFAELMNGAAEYLARGEPMRMGANQDYEDVFWPEENSRRFWEAYERLTGEKVGDRGSFFSCAC